MKPNDDGKHKGNGYFISLIGEMVVLPQRENLDKLSVRMDETADKELYLETRKFGTVCIVVLGQDLKD